MYCKLQFGMYEMKIDSKILWICAGKSGSAARNSYLAQYFLPGLHLKSNKGYILNQGTFQMQKKLSPAKQKTFLSCTLAGFLTWQNWNFKNPINFLCVILCPNQDLEKAFYSNIAPSIRTESHFLDLLRATCRKSIVVHIF